MHANLLSTRRRSTSLASSVQCLPSYSCFSFLILSPYGGNERKRANLLHCVQQKTQTWSSRPPLLLRPPCPPTHHGALRPRRTPRHLPQTPSRLLQALQRRPWGWWSPIDVERLGRKRSFALCDTDFANKLIQARRRCCRCRGARKKAKAQRGGATAARRTCQRATGRTRKGCTASGAHPFCPSQRRVDTAMPAAIDDDAVVVEHELVVVVVEYFVVEQ